MLHAIGLYPRKTLILALTLEHMYVIFRDQILQLHVVTPLIMTSDSKLRSSEMSKLLQAERSYSSDGTDCCCLYY